MASGNQAVVLEQIRRLYRRGTNVGSGEERLLDRFVSDRDETALESLVERHGPMVLGVCRRLLSDPHDVDDAFQATFLVFVRKAHCLRDRDRLGPWLHGVAHRVAVRARANVTRRRTLEERGEIGSSYCDPVQLAQRNELCAILDTEIGRLPSHLRLPVILCYLEGRTYEEAAQHLCWTVSTVRGRLVQARHYLRRRLTRQGIAPTLAVPFLIAGRLDKAESLSRELVSITLKSAHAGAIGNSVAALVIDTLRSLDMSRIRAFSGMAVAVGVVLLGMGLGVAMIQAQPNPDPKPIPKSETSKKANPAKSTRKGSFDRELHEVTVTGRAIDENGKPIAGAEIQVIDDNSTYSTGKDARVLGRTTSGTDGRYVLRKLPIPVLTPPSSLVTKPSESKFEVSGWVAGKAFAWHKAQKYRPQPRPAQVDPKDTGLIFFEGETIEADLTFGPPARIHGKVVDDSGKPVAGALIQVGYVNDVRKSGSGMWHCSTIALDGADPLAFSGIEHLPEFRRAARTDADGNYAIDGLPREIKLATLIDFDPSYEPLSMTVATSLKPVEGTKNLGFDGALNHTFVTPRTVRVRARMPQTGQPAVNVTITAQGPNIQRSGAIGKTNAEGIADLHLPPAPYTLRIEPPSGMVAVMSEQSIIVAKEPRELSVDVTLSPGAIVVLEVVEGTSKKGVAGVGFDYVTDTTLVPRPVQSQTVFIDHPVTGFDGRLQVVMPPGSYRFLPRVDPTRLEPLKPNRELLTARADTSVVVWFSFKNESTTKAQADEKPADDTRVRHLQERWKAQTHLAKRGRLRGSRTYQAGEGIAPDRFKALMDSLAPNQIPDLDTAIHKVFPEAAPATRMAFNITVDEPKRREEGQPPDRDVNVFNGRESIRYGASNGQSDIFDNSQASSVHITVGNINEYCHLARLNAPIIAESEGRLMLERADGGNLSQLVADEASGFVYRDWFSYNNGKSSRGFWQFAPKATPEGLVAPGLQVEMDSYENRINAIWIRTIESIDLSTLISSEDFVVSVPAGTMILDYRNGREDTYRGVVRGPVTDVLARANEIAATRKPFVSPVKLGGPAPPVDPALWLDRTGKTSAPKMAGRVVLVDFWGVTCGPCVAQLPEVREAVKQFANTDLLIVGLHDSSGTVKTVSEFAAKRDLAFPLAIDRATEESGWFGATFAAYGVHGIPNAAVIDRQGHVVFVGQFREALEKAAALLQTKANG